MAARALVCRTLPRRVPSAVAARLFATQSAAHTDVFEAEVRHLGTGPFLVVVLGNEMSETIK